MTKFSNFIDRNEFNGLISIEKNDTEVAWKVIITEFLRQNSYHAFLVKTIAQHLGFSDENRVRQILNELVNEGYLKRAEHAQAKYYIWRIFPFNPQTASFSEA